MKHDGDLRSLEIFSRAIELEGEARARFLESSCAGDVGLRRDVERLIREDSKSGGLLDRVALPSLEALAAARTAPARIGRYAIDGELGSGGMGTVYRAVQDEPRRVVALKTLRRSQLSENGIKRFRFEAEVLGSLRHPGIAQVYEAGTDGSDDAFFIAMEYVEGARDLIRYADEHGLGTRQRLELFLSVCEAVHHGHQRGVIHRDLKPGNLLVDREGRVKVIDFGLARVTEAGRQAVSAAETQAGAVFGTLRYMSPEQLDLSAGVADVPSDVYSLGVVLFELLTGELPVDTEGQGLATVLATLRESEPRRLGSVDPRLAGDLEWIVGKALAREPERRYASVRELAEDLRRHLRYEPVLASPPSRVYQLGKFARRHRAPLGALAAVFVALAVGLVRAEAAARAEQRAREAAELEAEVAGEVSAFLAAIFTEVHPYAGGADARLSDVMEYAESRLAGVERPAARAILAGLVGQGRLNVGDLEAAEPFLFASVELGEQVFEPDALHRLRNEISWADWLEQAGRYGESRDLSADILERGAGVLERRDRFYVSYNLAVCESRLGRHREAEAIYRELLEHELDVQESWTRVINLTHKVGGEVLQQRRYGEARELLEEALARCDEMPGNELYAATIRMELGFLHLELGEIDEAVGLLERAGAAFERGDAAVSNRAGVALGLARAMIAVGALEEAQGHLAEARRFASSQPGTSRLDVHCTAVEAELQAARGDVGEALRIAERALALADETAGAGSSLAARAFEALAGVAALESAEAEREVARRAWERFRDTRGPDDPETTYWRYRVRTKSDA